MEDKKNRNDAFPDHEGSEKLIDKYNINDQAHSDSSTDDFVPTISTFRHADGTSAAEDQENPNLKSEP